jgi:hypothetical protein
MSNLAAKRHSSAGLSKGCDRRRDGRKGRQELGFQSIRRMLAAATRLMAAGYRSENFFYYQAQGNRDRSLGRARPDASRLHY